MAVSWARKRQIFYVSGVLLFCMLCATILYFLVWYQPPSCFDGVQNQDEVGRDCGGVCERACVEQARPLNVLWAEAFPVFDTVYNAVAYVENANTAIEARNLEYEFLFYGPSDEVIAERSGTTFVPRNMRIGIFEERINTQGTPITRTAFRFRDDPEWYRDTTPNPEFRVEDSALVDEDTEPFVQATLVNESVQTLRNIDAVVVVYDDFNNPIAASRTVVPRIDRGGSAPLTYTWPQAYTVGERICDVPVDAVLAVDRSGSMDDDQLNPPEPLTRVKQAAERFMDEMGRDDKVGVVSFATTASRPLDTSLTFDHDAVRSVIGAISIGTDGIQHTNIADGLAQSMNALQGGRATSSARHAIILLTDGVATRPLPPDGSSIDEEEYAENAALRQAQEAKESDYQVYVIGLGDAINPDFLRELASTPDHFFVAPTSEQLNEVYTEIASAICKLGPKVIEIIPRLPAAEY